MIFDPARMVRRWFWTYLRRSATDKDVQYYVNLAASNGHAYALADILASAEYYSNNGGTADGFVAGLANDLVDSSPVAGELSLWSPQAAHDRRATAFSFMSQLAPQLLGK